MRYYWYKTYQNVARKRAKKAPDARTGNGWQPKLDFEASPLSRGLLPCSLVVSSVQTPEIADMPLICGSWKGKERSANRLSSSSISSRSISALLSTRPWCHSLGSRLYMLYEMRWHEPTESWCFTISHHFFICFPYLRRRTPGLCPFCLDPQHSLGSMSRIYTFIAATSPTWSWSSHLSSSGHQLLSNWLPEGCSAGRRCCV